MPEVLARLLEWVVLGYTMIPLTEPGLLECRGKRNWVL